MAEGVCCGDGARKKSVLTHSDEQKALSCTTCSRHASATGRRSSPFFISAAQTMAGFDVVTCSTSAEAARYWEATLLRVGGDGGAHAVGADSLNGSGHGELLQASFEVAVLSLQLLLHV